MALTLSTKGKKSFNEYTGRAPAPLPGRYHVAVDSAVELEGKNGKDPSLEVEFVVLCDRGTTPGQAGKVHKEFFAINDKAFNQDRLGRLAMILGLIGGDQEGEVDFAQGKGKQLVVELKEETYQGAKRVKINGMGFWPVGDEAVKDVPIEETMLGQVAAPAPVQQQIPVGAGAAVAPAPAGKPANKWANL